MAGLVLVKFRDALEALRYAHPLPFKESVSRRKLKGGLQGYCNISKKISLSIVIDKGLSEAMQSDVLIHEWAHGLLAAMPHEFATHGSLWGVMYARCYVSVYGD